MSTTYGEWLKAQREARGMTQQALADAAMMTRTHIAHIEAGRRVPSKEDAWRLDKALGTGDVLTSFRPEGTPVRGQHFDAARELEQQATVIREFAHSLVPGILQTERYARAVLQTAFPPWGDAECDRVVVSRLERAKILADPVQPVVWALLDEAVLRRPVGGPDVMAEQIMHIVRLAEVGRVLVHLLPLSLGAHSMMQAMVTLMSFEDQPPAAYTEGLRTGMLIDDQAMVELFRGAYDRALGDALPRPESLALMKEIAKEFGQHD